MLQSNVHKILILFISLTIFIATHHQDLLAGDTITKSTYHVSYKDKLQVYTYGLSKFSNFEFKESGQKNDSLLKYGPNGNFAMGLGFSYKWLAFSAGFKPYFLNNDNELKGETKSLDLQLDIYTRRMLLHSNLQFYQGYFWKNPEAFYSDWNKQDSLVVRPDISTIILGVKGIYIFNHDEFSFKAAYQHTERQLRSSGSMLLGSRFSLYGISADSTLIPVHLKDYYPHSAEIGSISSLSFGGSFGYTYTFVIGQYFFINALLMTGVNAQLLGANALNGEQLEGAAKVSTNITLRIGLGVSKPRLYYGLNYISDSFFIQNPNDIELTYKYGRFQIYYGLRFNIRSNK